MNINGRFYIQSGEHAVKAFASKKHEGKVDVHVKVIIKHSWRKQQDSDYKESTFATLHYFACTPTMANKLEDAAGIKGSYIIQQGDADMFVRKYDNKDGVTQQSIEFDCQPYKAEVVIPSNDDIPF